MRKLFFILLSCCLVSILSCSKNANRPPANTIEIRIENALNINFSNVLFKDQFFGSLQPGHVSEYKSFTDVMAYAGAQIVVGKDTVYAGMGYCGTGPLPMLKNGRYTLRIFEDQQYQMYNAEYIEEK